MNSYSCYFLAYMKKIVLASAVLFSAPAETMLCKFFQFARIVAPTKTDG